MIPYLTNGLSCLTLIKGVVNTGKEEGSVRLFNWIIRGTAFLPFFLFLPTAFADEITSPSVNITGFSDLNYSDINNKSGFNEGQFVLHFSSVLSPKTLFMGELSLTPRTDAGSGTPATAGFNVEVERSFIRFEHNDQLKISWGRYHTPLNWWNTAFHHGLWLQTTISRPEMIQFGGKLIPIHFVGGLIEGVWPGNGINLNYNLGVGNGRAKVISRSGDAGDANNNRAGVLNLFSKPDRFFGLQAGVSYYLDRIERTNLTAVDEEIASAHLIRKKENPEVIVEFANINHEVSDGSANADSQVYYAQVAYRLPWFGEQWKPYYRLESIDIPTTEMVFSRTEFNRKSSIAGLRYDFSEFTALKAEHRNLLRVDGEDTEGYFLQISFTF